jgi:GLPGLI family protein
MSIRKFICFLFLLASIISANAQNNYTITYSQYSGAAMIKGKLSYISKSTLQLHIYDDTLSFCRFLFGKPSMSKKLNVLDRYSHHGVLHHLKSDSILEVSTGNKDDFFIKFCKSYNWKITNDTTTIFGIQCVKAKSDSGVTVWFAPSIPVNSGPGVFYGLPGLILQVSNNKYHQLFVTDNIQKEVPPLDYPNNIKIYRVDEYIIMRQNFFKSKK